MARAPSSLPDSTQPALVSVPVGVADTMYLLGLASTAGASATVRLLRGRQYMLPAVQRSWHTLNTNVVVVVVSVAAAGQGKPGRAGQRGHTTVAQ